MIKNILYGLFVCISLGFGSWLFYQVGRNSAIAEIKEFEQHDLCYDTPKYEAWVAKKNGMYRCFMEWREYPHRVRASHIDYE